MTIESIADGTVVSIHYTLRDADGEVLDSSSGSDPLVYLHGAENIVPGLEKELGGHKVGDTLKAVVAPADGYGERDKEPQELPRSTFPADAEIEAGMQIFAELDNGEHIPLWIAAADKDRVTVDPNHPLAGVTLHFEVEVTNIRAATDEEKAHGHPHGPGGHH